MLTFSLNINSEFRSTSAHGRRNKTFKKKMFKLYSNIIYDLYLAFVKKNVFNTFAPGDDL